MSDVSKLLAEFVDALAAGSAPEARDYLARVQSDSDRAELARGIETALMFASDELRHPRAADGSFVLGVSEERIERAARVTWPDAMPVWRSSAELTQDQLAERALRAGGIECDAASVAAASRWVAAMEAGAETVRSISERARAAIADVLGVARELFDVSGDFDPEGAVAFRADADADARLVASQLIDVASAIDAAIPEDAGTARVDDWFSA